MTESNLAILKELSSRFEALMESDRAGEITDYQLSWKMIMSAPKAP
jgi:hypothetical protein